ncbi:MAG: GNAT family N-acetyltransferase [Asgard group archaeon]|nr:GNAT family N-acetyltransferase [Asgard group archaeon]
MSIVNIRPGIIEDYEKIANVFMKSFLAEKIDSDRYKKIVDYYKLIIEENLTNFTVLELNNEIIGIGGETRYNGSSIIGFIGVIPSHRRKGYATQIFDKILNESKKFNSTFELFANIGADSLYKKFGFVVEYLTFKCEISSKRAENSNMDITINTEIPSWILKMDKNALGYDRSKLLYFLLNSKKTQLVSIEKDGFAFCNEKTIGPIIARNEETAEKLISYYLLSGDKIIFIPEYNEFLLESFTYKKAQTCIKMILGEQPNRNIEWIYGFRAFATS